MEAWGVSIVVVRKVHAEAWGISTVSVNEVTWGCMEHKHSQEARIKVIKNYMMRRNLY